MKHGYFQRKLPDALSDLVDLAFDLRWNKCPAARHFWRRLDSDLWERTENPFLVLQSASQDRIDAAANDPEVLSELRQWRNDVQDYYNEVPEFETLDPDHSLKMVAYFSMEFGLSESLPIYSGGLGILAGDHLKTASDLGVPIVGIGLLYQQGYFRQVISDEGKQLEAYPFNDPGSLPVKPLADSDGHWLRVKLPLPGRTLSLRVWEARVGRVRLFLLDSNHAMNTPWDRGVTAQLYPSGRETRLLQEIVLGVGGWRLIEWLGLDVDVCHLNEGHAAFVVLARAASFAKRHNVSLRVAFAATRAGNVFTTHTPVEAAFDRFDPHKIETFAGPFLKQVGISTETLLALGRRNSDDSSEKFSMAWLAMHGACHVNAVSKLHGEVSRDLFQSLFPRWPRAEVPIGAITNGVHVPTWASSRAARLWDEAGPRRLRLDSLKHVADQIRKTPPAVLWSFRTEQRKALLEHVAIRRRHRDDRSAGKTPKSDANNLLDPNVLTIGFARRFATYKRSTLLLSDPERLKRLLLDQHRPVQLIVAGKAHPDDTFGKGLVEKMTRFLDQPELRGRAVFVEDYDMVLGRYLATGVDVWLNTPLRPNEACGTSGMKVLVNGGVNVSVPDGWWDEALPSEPSGDCPADVRAGWVVGSRDSGTMEEVNRRDAASLLDILEYEVIPEFYDHDDDGIPHRWIGRVKESMAGLTPQFSATRMLHEYVQAAYLPAARAFHHRAADSAKSATDVLRWNYRVRAHWDHVRIGQVRFCDCEGHHTVRVECWLDDLLPDDIRVQLYADPTDGFSSRTIIPLRACGELPGAVNGFIFVGEVSDERSIDDFTVRIVPHHKDAFIPSENQCILWGS